MSGSDQKRPAAASGNEPARRTHRPAKTGLVLSIWRLGVMGLPYRVLRPSAGPGFQPGMRNLLEYELRKLWHRVYERERLLYYRQRLQSLLRR